MQAKALVRLTGIILSLCLLTTIAAKAQAGAGDLGSTESFNINDGSVIIDQAGDYTITGGDPTDKTITVQLSDKDAVANITIEGVDITTNRCPFNIIQGVVKLTLVGKDDKLQAGDYCAALQVSENSELVITEKSTGKLTARGGSSAAGIGGVSNSSAGSITIAGGTVEATGGYFGAGIGGGYGGSAGSITISGGKVTTEGNIGDGESYYGSPAQGKISGGTIVCKSISPTFTITGGSVRTEDISVIDGKVMAVVKGSSKELPANSKVTSITIGGVTYNWTDVYTDENGMLYLYLNQDQLGSATVTIDTQTYTANASREYDITKGPITITAAGDYAIVGGGTQTENAITVDLPNKEDVANITIEGVKITTSDCPFDIKQGTVNLTLEDDDNELQAGDRCAALQVSWNSKLLITKESTGKLTATGGSDGAGIGGGNAEDAGSITIAGGTVEARGGDDAAGIGVGQSNVVGSIIISGGTVVATGGGGGAGIGGFNGSITISGGTVDATGGNRGAGIGGGSGSYDVSIIISGGKITTKGNIGAGEGGRDATGKISGGTIVCKSISPTLSITGGSVRTDDNSIDEEGKGMAVIKNLKPNAEVTSITIDNEVYGAEDVFTDNEGKLYLYISCSKLATVEIGIGGETKTIENVYTSTSLVVTSDSEFEYVHTNRRLTIKEAGTFYLKGAFAFLSDEEKKTKKVSDYAIDYVIAIDNQITGNVTLHLDGVSIKSLTTPLYCNISNIVIVLDGDNYLEGSSGSAINKDSDGSLTIKGTGRLVAKGAPAIGSKEKNVSNITIEGGTIEAFGSDGFPGIGSGPGKSTANISITGGSVNAEVEGITNQTKTEVTFPAMPGEKVVETSMLDKYGLKDMNLYPDDNSNTATLYLWLPDNFDEEVTINGYSATVKAGSPVTLNAITIKGSESYNENTHQGKPIKITSGGIFTINTEGASVVDLEIEEGGKLVTTEELKVTNIFTVKRKATNQWATFCSPVAFTLLDKKWATNEVDTDCLYLKSGYNNTTNQEWAFRQSIEKDIPYLLAGADENTEYILCAQNVTIPKGEKIKVESPSGFDNYLLFSANTSLTEQTLKDIYVLDVPSQKLVLKTEDYILKPFEAYFIASPASPTPPAIESQGDPGRVTSPELRAMPNDIIMPQKLTLKQPHSGKGSFTVKEDKEGQVAYGFALEDATVTLKLEPNTTDGYSVDNSLIKVYETGKSTSTIQFNGSGNIRTFTMPNAPVTIEVEFMKELTINPDEGQVVYADEKIEEYHPTYTVGNLTEGDKDIAFTGNLKVGDGDKIVNDNLSAGDNYKLVVTSDVIVTKLDNKNAKDAVATLNGSQATPNSWYSSSPIKLLPPSGFLIKQTPAPAPAPASLALRDAADADGYKTELTFSDEGEHTIHYSLKRKATNEEYGGKSITYKLDSQAPTYNVSVSNRTATVKLTDAVSGLASCSYQWDGGAEQAVAGFTEGGKEATFTLTGKAGTHRLKLTAIDQAGNILTEDNIEVTLEDPYVPPYNPDEGDDDNNDDNKGDDDGDDPDPDPIDPVANEAIQAPAFGIYVYNGKLCLEAAEPCRVMIHSFSGTPQHIRQLPAGKTCLYDLPAGRYIVTLHAPSAQLTQKVMVK